MREHESGKTAGLEWRICQSAPAQVHVRLREFERRDVCWYEWHTFRHLSAAREFVSMMVDTFGMDDADLSANERQTARKD